MATGGWSTKPDGEYVQLRFDEIWRYLRRRGWTVAELGRRMRPPLSRSYLHRLLTAQAACDKGKAQRIADAFGTSVEAISDDLVGAA